MNKFLPNKNIQHKYKVYIYMYIYACIYWYCMYCIMAPIIGCAENICSISLSNWSNS